MFEYPPIFVVGVGRSGTTLVQSMLNAHPEICFPPETAFFRRYVANGKANHIYANEGKQHLLSVLSSDSHLCRLAISVEQVVQELICTTDNFAAANLYALLLKAYAKGQSKPRIGDKDPKCIEHLPALSHYFPDAYVIHVVRDPCDTIVSRSRAAWSRQRSFYHHLFVYNTQLRMGYRLGPSLFKERYITVVYEQLIQQPEETLRELCRGLEVCFDPATLSFSEAAKGIVAEDEMEWKREVLGPLLSNNFGKWKGVLSNWQVALVDSLCGDLMIQYNYPLSNNRTLLSDMVGRILAWCGSVYGHYRCLQQKLVN